MIVRISECQRCGRPHDLEFTPLNHPVDEFRHWSTCPYTSQPVLLALAAEPEPEPEPFPIDQSPAIVTK